MKTFQAFSIVGEAFLKDIYSFGLYGFSWNRKEYKTHVSVNTVWLRLSDGTVLRVGPEMHELENWDEVGSLEIERVESTDAPSPIVELGDEWRNIASIEKLVFTEPDYFSADSGLKITNRQQEVIIICNGAGPYELALMTPVTQDVFNPEHDLERYLVYPAFCE